MFGPGDYFAMIGMAFALIMTLVIGGFVLVFPIARRLGEALEEWLRLRREGAEAIPAQETRRLTGAVASLRDEVDRLAARQEFLESLLERERPDLSGAERHRVTSGGNRSATG